MHMYFSCIHVQHLHQLDYNVFDFAELLTSSRHQSSYSTPGLHCLLLVVSISDPDIPVRMQSSSSQVPHINGLLQLCH